MKQFYVYILASNSKTLYVGITSNLERRLYHHKNKIVGGFTKQYGLEKLVHYEVFRDPYNAITREKQIKGWLRNKKITLIEEGNPNWIDLSEDWL